MRAPRLAAGLTALALAGAAPAQERPSDEELFGAPAAPAPEAPPAPPKAAPAPPAPAAAHGDHREAELLGGGARGPLDAAWSKEKEDPLKIGGLLYLRGVAMAQEGVSPDRWPLTAPMLVDTFLDARPNDRVRGFALARLLHDPTKATQAPSLLGKAVTQPQSRVLLDQLYVNFDLERTVFMTVGKQHVKWGTGHFWNPGDFLHTSRRDPLSQYDERTGLTMVKAHLPWEARGWNLYGVAVLEDLAGWTTDPAGAGARLGTVGKVGGAARAEVVLGAAELGASAAAQRGHAPRFGFDASFPLGDLDLLGELTLTKGRDAPAWRAVGDVHDLASWRQVAVTRVTPQAVAGVSWSYKYSDEDALTLGGEYFFNDAGYADAHAYPALLASPSLPVGPDGAIAAGGAVDPRTAFTPFYLGRHYLGAFLTLPRPGSWNDTTFSFTGLANLSDGSGLLRLDHSVLVNTYLTVETFAAVHGGTKGGEFRLGFTIPAQKVPGIGDVPPFPIPAPIAEVGVALRVKL